MFKNNFSREKKECREKNLGWKKIGQKLGREKKLGWEKNFGREKILIEKKKLVRKKFGLERKKSLGLSLALVWQYGGPREKFVYGGSREGYPNEAG